MKKKIELLGKLIATTLIYGALWALLVILVGALSHTTVILFECGWNRAPFSQSQIENQKSKIP